MERCVHDIVTANQMVHTMELPMQRAKSIRGLRTVDEASGPRRSDSPVSEDTLTGPFPASRLCRCIQTRSGWSLCTFRSLSCWTRRLTKTRLWSSAVERETGFIDLPVLLVLRFDHVRVINHIPEQVCHRRVIVKKRVDLTVLIRTKKTRPLPGDAQPLQPV